MREIGRYSSWLRSPHLPCVMPACSASSAVRWEGQHVSNIRPYTNSTTATWARCRTRDIGMSPSWSSEWASQKMVGPRFSVNALAETKFICLPEGDDRFWQTLKKYPCRQPDALLTDAIVRNAARSTGQKKSGPALPTKVSRDVRYWHEADIDADAQNFRSKG